MLNSKTKRQFSVYINRASMNLQCKSKLLAQNVNHEQMCF